MEVGVRAKGVTEKEHVDEAHRITPLQTGQSSGSTHSRYLPCRWKEDGVVTISFYKQRPPSTGDRRGGVWGIFVLKVKLWHQRDGVPVIRMNRSVHPVNLGKQLNLFCFPDPWRFALREAFSPAPRNLAPLQLPSPHELKRVHKNIPLLVIIHHPLIMKNFNCLDSVSGLLPYKGRNSLSDVSIKNKLTDVLKHVSLWNENFLFHSPLRRIGCSVGVTIKCKRTYF